MFNEEDENYFFDDKYLDECSFGSNNHFQRQLDNFEFELKNYSNDEIFNENGSDNNEERYNENKMYFNENKLNLVKNLTEVRADAKTGATTLKSKEKDGLIFKITKEIKQNQNIVGRKRKDGMGGKHNKYCYDNVTRKLKTKLFESILNVLNISLQKVEIENTKKYSKKKLYSKPFFLKINQDIIKDINVDNNNKLLKSTLKEIYSTDVSKKMENYGLDHNKNLIETIYKEQIQTKAIGILDRTLLECLEHFRGSKYYKELEGLEKEYKSVIENMKQNEPDDYIEIFEDFVKRFEIYYGNKKARPKKNSNEENLN